MPNPRFLQTAKHWMNKDLSVERAQSLKDLTQRLERDGDGKPILNLTHFEKTAVHVPTEEDWGNLMRSYECGGWKWTSEKLPTKQNVWTGHREETVIGAGVNYFSEGKYDEGKFCYGLRSGVIMKENWDVISAQEFYSRQNPPITSGMLSEINKWFDEN